MTALSSLSRARSLRTVLVVGLLAVTAFASGLVLTSTRADAANMSSFDPGYLVSDLVFYDSGSMSADGVQAFLNTKGASCQPLDGPCLKAYRQATTNRAADDRCRGSYAGSADESAAQIIVKVAQACGINPRVILVTLQKEQGLVTKTRGAADTVYRKAMGFGCPDTSACDSKYYGFFNQVYSAAWQFRSYALNPTKFNHRAGVVNNVRFHPDAACGTSPVLIRNQATASLYNYTPYQPNAAALAAGYGTGDSCSSYGNRNFWAYFTDWFGSTISPDPVGFLDSVSVIGATTVRASGWTLDPDTTDPITVHVYVDSTPTGVLANSSRPDIGTAYPGWGDNHGFSVDIPVKEGTHSVCAYAINQPAGYNPPLGCRTVSVVNSAPTGSLDAVTATASTVTVQGWAYDRDTADPLSVHVYANGQFLGAVTADKSRPDVGAAVAGAGPNRGFAAEFPVASGRLQVCVYPINVPASSNPGLGCRTVDVVNALPTGFVDQVSATAGTIRVGGWVYDKDSTSPTTVHMYVDNAPIVALLANQPRPDVAAAVPAAGSSAGFSGEVPATAGRHTVCLYAINQPTGVNPQLGCRDVTVG